MPLEMRNARPWALTTWTTRTLAESLRRAAPPFG